ncbi:hypothetical protein [Chryseobacterium jejuense]|uniref:hypothetical protein n=1 Tax=Chryseobacterium jejuense TaxID=445960 RepID=UPI001AEA40EE|nr:hypothetical protein [Chryseobacterium jejuense]MBP2616849.1 putative membrane protein [Chryseobacterium jejuense]
MKNFFIKQPIYIIAIILFIIILYPICLNLFIDDSSKQGLFGDSFGALNTFFSALAFCGVIISMMTQRRDFKESKYQYLHDRMTSFVYVQLDRYEKGLAKLELVNNNVKTSSNEGIYFLYENLERINLYFTETREERLTIALHNKKEILQNLTLIKESSSRISSFIISTDNCFLTFNEILNTSGLTSNDKEELKTIFNKNVGYMLPDTIQTIYNTIYLARVFRFELEIGSDELPKSLLNLLNLMKYFQIFHHSNH